MSETDKKSLYDKLTPQRKQLIDEVLKNLESGTGLWKPGWKMTGVPESAITGKRYRGVNNFFLTLISMMQGYKDNRWATFKQIEERGWHFRTDEEGKSLAKGKGASIEFFELRDNKTKQPFRRSTLDGMTEEEKEEYLHENVKPIRKYYRVFNGDLIDGIPEKESTQINPNDKVPRAENILSYWNENESKIIYEGDRAFYRISSDEIYLPPREDFYSMQEFYSTALHEIGHSTGHESRLNRDIKNSFGSGNYAQEELRAEIASMFIEQDLEISVSEKHIENNSAYIKNWHEEISENPNALFSAIADADKIAKFVMLKEQTNKKTDHYAIVEDKDAYGETVYKVFMAAEHGQIALAINYAFSSKDALMAEFQKMQGLPFWTNSVFQEVSFEELQEISLQKAKEAEELSATEEEIVEEKSEVYIKPSEIVAKTAKKGSPVDMAGRGVESLAVMSDRDVVERAGKTKNGDKFTKLYNGESVLGSDEKDERSLMSRLAIHCGSDKEKLLRVFKSSGQFKEEKPDSFYERIAKESMDFVSKARHNSGSKSKPFSGEGKGLNFGLNSKN